MQPSSPPFTPSLIPTLHALLADIYIFHVYTRILPPCTCSCSIHEYNVISRATAHRVPFTNKTIAAQLSLIIQYSASLCDHIGSQSVVPSGRLTRLEDSLVCEARSCMSPTPSKRFTSIIDESATLNESHGRENPPPQLLRNRDLVSHQEYCENESAARIAIPTVLVDLRLCEKSQPYKARLVANGSSQQLGVDFDETFRFLGSLNNEFDMTDLGALNYFLGISADRTPTESKLGPEGASGTLDLGLHLYASSASSLVGYTDADWASCPSTCSAEAEYRGVTNVVAETAWLRNLLRELHSPLSTATLVYCDNVSAVYMSANPIQHQRTKHIEIDIHFVRDMVTAGQVRVLHVPSRFQYADIFTKGLPSALFEEF
ncbi:ribonuclease H-like domain-containing protein [Tanacetum coccineum]